MPILSTGTNVFSFKFIAGSYQDNLEGTYQSQLNSISQSRRSLIILNTALIWITKMPPEMYGQRVAQRTMTYRSLLRGQETTTNLGSYQGKFFNASTVLLPVSSKKTFMNSAI